MRTRSNRNTSVVIQQKRTMMKSEERERDESAKCDCIFLFLITVGLQSRERLQGVEEGQQGGRSFPEDATFKKPLCHTKKDKPSSIS